MRKEQQVAAQNPILEEEEEVPEGAVMARKKKERKTRKHEEQILSSPSPSAAAILVQEAKLPKKRKRSKEHGPSAQSPLPFGPARTHSLHLQGTTPPTEQPEAAHASNGKSTKTINTKKRLSNREIIKMRLEQLREQQARFVAAAMSEAHGLNSVSNCTEQNPNHSSPFGAFFDQFCYKPVRQDRSPSLHRTPDHLARLPPQGYPAFESSQLTANDTSEASKSNTSLVSNTKLQGSGSGSQANVNVKENTKPEKKMEEKQMLSSSGPETPTLEQEAKATKKRMRTKEQEQSGPSQAHCVLQGTTAPSEQGADVKKNNAKKPRVLSNRKIIKIRIEHLRKQQARFVATAMSEAHGPNSISNCTEQNPNHSSPFGAFFDQFCYKPIRQDRNPLLPRTPDRLARLPPRGYPSFESSQLTANETSKLSKANTSVVFKTKQQHSGSGSQAKVNVEEKQRKLKPLLTSAEKRSDKYRRLPLDQLVPPPRSPHMLLQEEYASDPWKVIVICMLLNLTQGKQVKKIVNEFFRLYPDAQTAFNADPKEMEGYLAPLGLQRVKTIRIQQFSREYVEKQWNYITELCGVGKYAADAYAIFCAGRATEVVPEDHKLVDYWKYVCFEMPQAERATNTCNL